MPILILILIALFVVIPGIRVVNQYERGVVQRLGRFRRIMEPGLHVIIPYILMSYSRSVIKFPAKSRKSLILKLINGVSTSKV